MHPCGKESVKSGVPQSSHKRPFSEVFMLASRLFCRSVARYQQIAVVSFAENGRFIGHAKNGIFGFPVPITMKNQVLLNQLPLV